ncbi:MAG: hypothetical protein LUP91_15490, partial [Methylococcaceae bacterium]|nr:hypothetical protein [Methylococcaceae bacterium]
RRGLGNAAPLRSGTGSLVKGVLTMTEPAAGLSDFTVQASRDWAATSGELLGEAGPRIGLARRR